MPTSSSNFVGISCALGAWLAFSLNDVGIKLLSGDYALHQIVLIRSCVAILITLFVIMPMEGGLSNVKTSKPLIHIFRGVCVVFSNMMFFLGLAVLPLPDATSIFFVAPLMITALSVVFLGEKVGLFRWMAVSIGMVGVIVMMRPGSDAFRIEAFLPVFAALGYAGLQILTRKIGFVDKASTMSFYIQVVFIVVCSIFGFLVSDGRYDVSESEAATFLLRAWVMPGSTDLAIMSGLGVATSIGGYLISRAYREAEATLIAPFEYLALAYAIFWSVFIWDTWPDWVGWIGIALILVSGLTVFWREMVLSRPFVSKHPLPRNR